MFLGDLTYTGLLNFGAFSNLTYEMFELYLFVTMGAFGGLMGSLFNHANYKLTVFRMRWVKTIDFLRDIKFSCMGNVI